MLHTLFSATFAAVTSNQSTVTFNSIWSDFLYLIFFKLSVGLDIMKINSAAIWTSLRVVTSSIASLILSHMMKVVTPKEYDSIRTVIADSSRVIAKVNTHTQDYYHLLVWIYGHLNFQLIFWFLVFYWVYVKIWPSKSRKSSNNQVTVKIVSQGTFNQTQTLPSPSHSFLMSSFRALSQLFLFPSRSNPVRYYFASFDLKSQPSINEFLNRFIPVVHSKSPSFDSLYILHIILIKGDGVDRRTAISNSING